MLVRQNCQGVTTSEWPLVVLELIQGQVLTAKLYLNIFSTKRLALNCPLLLEIKLMYLSFLTGGCTRLRWLVYLLGVLVCQMWDLRVPKAAGNVYQPLYTLRSHSGHVMLCWSPDDVHLLTSAVDNEVITTAVFFLARFCCTSNFLTSFCPILLCVVHRC